MAAIDKLYVHTYYEYDDIRKWAIAYYPELLFYFYDITMTYQQWEDNCADYVKRQRAISKTEYARIRNSKTSAVETIIKQYKEAGYDCPKRQAEHEAYAIIEAFHRSASEWEESYSCAIMSTPFKIDRKLLWICPIPCVRKYLEDYCGYKTRWYHKLFWRGKKHF